MSSSTLARRLPRCRTSLSRTLNTLSAARAQGAHVDVHPEVEEALASGKPVVALETTLVTNGLPSPTNWEVGCSMEDIVRSNGAVPATIGMISGRMKIGLERSELERLATRGGAGQVVKLSRRDVSAAMVKGVDGGTTIAATTAFAAMAGIKVFATGGMGGVHRNGENSLDISADLGELSRCPVAVVSSGVKSILDIGRTLEYLETLGVPVFPYQSPGNEFPAFFTPKSGFKLPWGVDSPLEAAQIIYAEHALGLSNGQFIAVPIPSGPSSSPSGSVSPSGGLLYQTNASNPSVASASTDAAQAGSSKGPEGELDLGTFVQSCVDQAVAEAEESGMSKRGKDVTPWLLARVRELSGGKSIELNVKLLERSAFVGGQIAVEYAKLARQGGSTTSNPSPRTTYVVPTSFPSKSPSSAASTITPPSPAASPNTTPESNSPATVLIAGCAAVDVISKFTPGTNSSISSKTTVPGKASLTLGGVGRNVAEACHRVLGQAGSALLVSPVGDDAFGRLVREEMRGGGMRVDGLFVPPAGDVSASSNGSALASYEATASIRTAVCNMVLDAQGELIGGVADMGIVEAALTGEAVIERITKTKPRVVCLDGNLSEKAIADVVRHCRRVDPSICLFFEPTSGPKSTRIIPTFYYFVSSSASISRAPIDFVSPNVLELEAIYQAVRSMDLLDSSRWWDTIESLKLGDKWRNEVELLSRLTVHPSAPGTSSERKLDWLVKQGVVQMAVNLLPFFQHILIKCGQDGVVSLFRTSSPQWAAERTNLAPHSRTVVSHYSLPDSTQGSIVLRHFPPLRVEEKDIINVTGAGDSFVGAVLAELATRSGPEGGFESPEMLEEVVNRGQKAAVMSLGAETSVSALLGGGW